MTLTFRLRLFAGMAALTLCLGPLTLSEVAAQTFPSRNSTYGFYNPYGGGYNGYSTYSGYGQGPYGNRSRGGYSYPSSNVYRYGAYYRGGVFPQQRSYGQTIYGNGSRYYNPYGYGYGRGF
jgi:hypothetical protein